jgi:hypothetical protein
MHPVLQEFVDDYRGRGVPPPHILLVGKDDEQNASIAREFARKLGTEVVAIDSSNIGLQGDFTGFLTAGKALFLSNVQHLKRQFTDRLIQAIATGDIKITIGTGPAARVHTMSFAPVAMMASCSAKYECPATLLKEFRTVLPIEPYAAAELKAVLVAEAGKSRISFEPGAAELLVRCSNGLSSVLMSRYKKVIGQIDQISRTNMPCLTVDEIATALAKLRIEIPTETPATAHRDMDTLTGQEFESLIKALLIEMGFQAELTEVTGDGGIDIVATLDRPFSGGRYIFQCKRYAENNVVGSPAVRDFYGAVMADKAVKGIFITTSDFTAQAKDFATQAGVELVNRARLDQLLEEYKVHTI